MLTPLLVLACATPVTEAPPDLSERLDADQARVGKVVDEASVFGGISAEGQAGDYKIYNDRAQFIIQGFRPSHYYLHSAGGVVDADVVRPEGEPGQDIVDDWAPMIGLGRLTSATWFEVKDNGAQSGEAWLRVYAEEVPMDLILGALESEDFVEDLGLTMVTDYRLAAGSSLMEVTTTVTVGDKDVEVWPGDIVLGSQDIAAQFSPGGGIGAGVVGEGDWSGYASIANDGALAIMSAPGESLYGDASAQILSAITSLQLAQGPEWNLAAGETASWTRYWGVARDLATLSDAHQAAQGTSTETAEGDLVDDSGPVVNAWIGIAVDGEPFTIARTDADGHWSAQVPSGGTVETEVVTDPRGAWTDLAPGHGRFSTYAPDSVDAAVLDSLTSGGSAPLDPGGRDIGPAASLTLSSADGGPFTAILVPSAGIRAVDERLAPPRVSGDSVNAWSATGTITLPLEPGEWSLVAHRGIRYELHQETLELIAGESTSATVTLEQAWEAPGWLAIDPHTHAAPSGDASIPMEERIVVSAATGAQVHVATDHDHVADYRPIIDALGLSDWTVSIVGAEVSPVLRGHINAYPLEPEFGDNNGAWLWYRERVDTTQEQFDAMRAWAPDAIFQSNHPMDNGLASAAQWETGEIGRPDFWTPDFDAVEVINDGDYEEYFAFYLDTLNRGILSTPTSVSDSHGHRRGSPGLDMTFLFTDAGLAEFGPEALTEAMRARSTVAAQGAFIDTSLLPGSELVGAQTLDVEVLHASWIPVDRIELWVNGALAETVAGESASFALDPSEDSSYVVVATSDSAIADVYAGKLAWSMTSAILIDVDGDGWEPPLGPLVVD